MKIREMIAGGIKVLQTAGIDCAESDAKILAQFVLKTDYTGLTLKYTEEAPEDVISAYTACINKRGTHYPCQYITGTQSFMGYEFLVAENVLIPRPETEILVETALLYADKPKGITTRKSVSGSASEKEMVCENGLKVLDMCCGSGCIGLSFKKCREAKGYMGDLVTLADVSDYALDLTGKNRESLGVSADVTKSDLFENITGKYDMILSNPPYIRSRDVDELMEDVRLYEPRLALDGTEDGLYFYKCIIRDARKFLDENGVVIFEIGYDQAEDIRTLLVDAGFADVEIIKDYADLDRVVAAVCRV